MLLKDHVDCRFLREGNELKRPRACQMVKSQTLFHNCPFCLVVSMRANIHLVRTSKRLPR